MTPYHPSLGMSDDYSHEHEAIPDPLDEFLAQLLSNIDDVLPTPITGTFPVSPSPFPSLSAGGLASDPYLICQWVFQQDPPTICGAPLSLDPKDACAHFRHAHDVRGNEKVTVNCEWHDCNAPPMLRGSLIRHVLSVHLRLLRWQCEMCGKVFSRKATLHTCTEESAPSE